MDPRFDYVLLDIPAPHNRECILLFPNGWPALYIKSQEALGMFSMVIKSAMEEVTNPFL